MLVLPQLLRDEEEGFPLTGTTIQVASAPARGNMSERSDASGTGWDEPTPKPKHDRVHDEDNSGKDDVKASMTLNRFVATHTSEDNDAFHELQEKAVADHQRRYHWAFDVDKEKGDPKLHLLTNGTWISKELRQIADEACAPKGLRFLSLGGACKKP
jgi:protein DGCR14